MQVSIFWPIATFFVGYIVLRLVEEFVLHILFGNDDF